MRSQKERILAFKCRFHFEIGYIIAEYYISQVLRISGIRNSCTDFYIHQIVVSVPSVSLYASFFKYIVRDF